MMAGFLNKLFGSRQSPTFNKQFIDDTYQKIADNQPQNIYQEVSLLYGHTAPVKHIIKINNSCFATASDDYHVMIWDSERGYQLHTLEHHTAPITCMLSFSLEPMNGDINIDDCIVMTSSAKELIIWELSSDERIDPELNPPKILTEHEGSINCLCVLKHGMVCSGGKDLCLWDVSSGKLLCKYDCSQHGENYNEVQSVIEMDGRSFGIIAASNYSQPAVYDIKKLTMTQGPQYILQFSAFLLSFHQEPISYLIPVSGTLFATGARDSSVVLWSMNSLSAVKKFECAKDDFLESPTLSPSTSATSLVSASASPISVIGIPVNQILVLCERYLFVAVGTGFKVFDVYSSDGTQSSHELQSTHKPLISHMQAHTGSINHMEFLPRSYMLLTASDDGTVRLWGPRQIPITTKTPPSQDGDAIIKYAVEMFLGIHSVNQQIGRGRRRSSSSNFPTVPVLLGELALHSDCVQVVRDLGSEYGLVTCGNDGMVFLWKNLELENEKRHLEIRKKLRGEMYYDASS